MKIKSLLALFLLVASACTQAQNHIQFKSVKDLQAFLTWKPNQYPLISAHRGGPMDGFPENSMEAFKNSIRYDAMVIEFDVSMSKDSVLVLMHDDKLERTTNGTGLLKDYSFAELQKLKLRDNQGNVTTYTIPTLDEVLAWAKGKVILTVDVKHGVPFEKVVKAIERNKAESCAVVITYNADQASLVHKLNPELMLSVSASKVEDVVRLNNAGVPNSRMVAFVGTSSPQASFYAYLQKNKIVSILGTMGNLDKSAEASSGTELYAELIKSGANILSTKNVILSTEQLKRLRKEQNLKSITIK